MNKRSARPSPTSRATGSATSQLRIIGGQWRGRKLPILSADGLRPTGDRLRETLFNWLMPDLHQARCLDLFAGSGALGFEAVSRGASAATLVESHAPAAAQLRANAERLGSDAVEVVEADALAWLKQAPQGQQDCYQIVFLDPPFSAKLWETACRALSTSGLLAPEARVYVETPRQHALQVPKQWLQIKEKTAGSIRAQLFVVGE